MKFDSKTLRELAEKFVDEITDDDDMPDSDRADIVTSLVRQWATYDGHAVFFAGVQFVFLILSQTPLGRPVIVPKPGPSNWLVGTMRGRQIDPDSLPDIVEQLNRGQSAEVMSEDGRLLRLSVNPQKESAEVELLERSLHSADCDTSYPAIAKRYLLVRFGDDLGDEELTALAASVATQWRKFDGHASVFVGPHEEVRVALTTPSDGPATLTLKSASARLDTELSGFGFSADEIPGLIPQINRGQSVECRPAKSPPFRVWYDPKQLRFVATGRTPTRFSATTLSLPTPCPKCSALLMPSRREGKPASCPLCGHALS